MRARLIVFPIKGRNWCFSRSIQPHLSQSASTPPPTFTALWKQISSNGKPLQQNAELVVDFVSDKMSRAWSGLEKAPQGTFKSKLHGLGLKLLARIEPSETFLKSISKDVTEVEVSYPTSLNQRLVRRRLRHIALRGSIIHRRYLYGSVGLLPFTAALAVLPLPNVPFFWVLFRTYSHWLALKGSERLLLLVSDCSKTWNLTVAQKHRRKTVHDASGKEFCDSPGLLLVFKPSGELEELSNGLDGSERAISDICKTYHLDATEVLKYRNTM